MLFLVFLCIVFFLSLSLHSIHLLLSRICFLHILCSSSWIILLFHGEEDDDEEKVRNERRDHFSLFVFSFIFRNRKVCLAFPFLFFSYFLCHCKQTLTLVFDVEGVKSQMISYLLHLSLLTIDCRSFCFSSISCDLRFLFISVSSTEREKSIELTLTDVALSYTNFLSLHFVFQKWKQKQRDEKRIWQRTWQTIPCVARLSMSSRSLCQENRIWHRVNDHRKVLTKFTCQKNFALLSPPGKENEVDKTVLWEEGRKGEETLVTVHGKDSCIQWKFCRGRKSVDKRVKRPPLLLSLLLSSPFVDRPAFLTLDRTSQCTSSIKNVLM